MADLSKLFVVIGAKTQGFEQGMGKVQKSSQSTMDKIKQNATKIGATMTAVGGVIVGAMGAATKSWADTGEQILLTSQKLGIGTEALSELHYAANQSGVSTETFNMALQRMTRRISEAAVGTGEAQGALEELGLSAKELEALPLDERFKVITESLAGVGNESDRVRLAMKLFDSEGVSLVQMMGDGAEGLDAFAAEARELGIVFSQDDAEGAKAFNDALTKLQGAFGGIAAMIGTTIVPTLTKVVDAFSGIITKVMDITGKIPFFNEVVIGGAAALGILLLALGPLLMLMPGISAVVGMTGLSFAGLAAGIGAAVVAAAPFLLVGAAIAALAYLIYDNWEDIVIFFEWAFNGIWEIVKKYWEWILLIIFPAAGIVALFIKHWEPISAFFTGLWEEVQTIFTDAWDALYKLFVTDPIDRAKAGWNAIKEFFTGLWESVTDIFQNSLDGILIIVTDPVKAVQHIWSEITGFFTGLWDDVKSVFTNALSAIESVGQSVADFFLSAWDNSIGWVIGLFEDLWDAAKNALDWILDKIDTVVNAAREAASWFDWIPGVGGGGGSSGDDSVILEGGGRGDAGGLHPPSGGFAPMGGGSNTDGFRRLNFATGGVVPGPIGSPQLAMVHGGEEVLTPEQRGGVTINMPGMVIREDADIDKIARALNRMMQQSAMVGA